ncbi:hemocytin-like [Ostrinia furnacalis]|uniref:hemocytin-like n=1 Tax=Ostrinia furnacalis TaxID=93504 RepID=UPI00103B19A0|nr:hemocytin-like [Ostrinia furnacalis]
MSYDVGATFRGENCDECVCKLGGVTDCKPVKECKCAPTLVPKLVPKPSCECFCEPCPPGTRICPTSKLCLALDKWCDGLQDCPDDEKECSTTTITTPKPTTLEPTIVTTVQPTVSFTAATKTEISTTPKPLVCPVVECPPNYIVRYTTPSSHSRSYTSDIPPPRPRYSYQRYQQGGYAKGGYAKGGYSKGGYSKGGYSKGGFSKGGYNPVLPTSQPNQAFTLDKPTLNPAQDLKKQECPQFKCVPQLPPPPRPGSTPAPLVCSAPACPPRYSLRLDAGSCGPQRPGSTPAPLVCSAPACPPRYSLRLDAGSVAPHECPQYSCVPPPERLAFCNVTERAVSTFDGADYKYDLCFHILARDNRFDAWSVLVRKKCRLDGCQNELIVHQDDQLIKVKPNLMIEYDNYEYTVEQTTKICFQKNSFDVAKLGNGLSIKSRRYNFTVLYNTDGDIKIGVSKKYMGTVDGLCGAFDGSLHNERRLPDGSLAANSDQMARAWGRPGLPKDACKTKVIDETKQKRVWELCDVITQEPLAKCGKVLSLDKWRNICLEKICKCTDLIVNGTKKTEEECRCLLVEKLVAECLAADKDVDISEWRMKLNCPAECPPPLVHFDCYRKRCEPSCPTQGVAQTDCPAEDGQCFPGCYCPPGTYRRGQQCLAPDSCLDCACKGVGTPAGYTTFEGDSFPFLGNCTYLASRDRNETGQHKYEVYATNGPCEDNANVTCTKTIHVIYEKNVIHISKDAASKKLATTIGNELVFKYPVKKDWVTISQLNGRDVMVMLTDAHVEVTVLASKMELSVRVPTFLYSNRTEGLCGVCAGSHEHLITSNGTDTDDFEEYGKSWQATPSALTTLEIPPEQQQCDQPPPPPPCTPPPAEENPCYNLYNPEVFGACHALVDPQSYVESCVEEQCSMNNSDVCATLARYADACRQQGVCLTWRSAALCPYPCEKPLVYRACVDCERTCDNHDNLEKHPDKCTNKPVEGCFCPEGKVRVNNTCIEPTKCFPCDVDKEHYAGDEWQEDACKKCTCSKLPGEARAHVACTTQACSAPVCAQGEDMLAKPKPPGACCDQYMCVPKPRAECEEPKKMECGFGQVLKQKTTANGCKEFACECKPASECEHIPTDEEVDFLEPGLERVIDNSGCCPKVNMVCRKEACPKKPDCPKFQNLVEYNVTGKCCQKYECEPPKDKCVVTLEWEAAPRGGEKARAEPEEVLKDIDEAWLDGPCRRCRCERSSLGASAQCSVTECPASLAASQFVLEPRPVPFACCPALVHVACRDGENVYRVGENWTSPYDVCESYSCSEAGDGKLEKLTTVKTCETNCQPGWKYFPAEASSKQCCGKCKPVACVVDGKEHVIGERWTSKDFCANYTCVDLNGTLQVQSSNESCPDVPEAVRKQFVLNEDIPPGQCCKKQEPVACRVGNKVYQEGQTWPSDDPCKNLTCSRDVTGRLTHAASVEACSYECKRGWGYRAPPPGVCCGRCVQEKCLLDDELVEPGTTWYSADNCTTYTCEKLGEDLLVTSARETCPDVSDCDPEDLVNDTCCQVCKEKPMALSTCTPTLLAGPASVGAIRAVLKPHGACYNDRPLVGFYECRGSCDSGTLYNNVTGIHDSKCECCTATSYGSVDIWLACADGSRQKHRVASPNNCRCLACGANASGWPGKKPTKGGVDTIDYDIPEIYQRMRIPDAGAR